MAAAPSTAIDLDAVRRLTDSHAFHVAASHEPGDLRLAAFHDRPPSDGILSGLYWIRADALDDKDKAALTLTPTVSSLAPKSAAAPFSVLKPHPTSAAWVGVPKFWGLGVLGPPKDDRRCEGAELGARRWNDDIRLRPEQEMAITSARDSLRVWGGAFIIADCGFGKSRCISRLVHEEARVAMIVVPQTVLVEQMRQEFQATDGRPPSLVGLRIATLQGKWDGIKEEKKAELMAADVVIASLDSLSLFRYPAALVQRFGLVIFDEAHHMAARTLCEVMPRLPTRRIAGFSATPDRTDGLAHLLFWILGPPCYVFQRLPEVTGVRHTVEVVRVSGIAAESKMMYGGKLAFAEMLNDLAADAKRNAMIVEVATSQLAEGRRKVLVITAFREHAELLRDEIKKAEPSTVILHGGLKKKEKESTRDKKVLVATYGILQEGFDDADLDTLIMATPRSSVQQTVGRIERVKEGKHRPRVLDIVDEHELFEAMWWKRHRFYKSRGFEFRGGAANGREGKEEEHRSKRPRIEFDDAVNEDE